MNTKRDIQLIIEAWNHFEISTSNRLAERSKFHQLERENYLKHASQNLIRISQAKHWSNVFNRKKLDK
ncbi:22440_t:CDS:2 [Cetraspora pellucida]|uniref:22440_t:CDS:1 n=1 Tax=Cetraspora pellucida TaxID=1433469 RepID=A0A9N9GGP6_9GLOM|nr:22440_t:CDS:2 [Cetraspora pellucida]